MQRFGTFLHQVGHLHTTKTCSALPPLIFTLAKPLARSTHCHCCLPSLFVLKHNEHDINWVGAIYQLTHTKYKKNIVLRVTAAVAGKAARAWWRRLPSDRKAQLRWLTVALKSEKNQFYIIGRGREGTRASLDSFVESAWLGSIRATLAMCLSAQVESKTRRG